LKATVQEETPGSIAVIGLTSGADFNAHRHISLPKILGRALVAAGAGANLTYAYGLATWWGLENVPLDITNMPSHLHSFSGTLPAHTHTLPVHVGTSQGGGGGAEIQNGGTMTTSSAGGGTISGNTSAAGSGVPHFNIPPSTYLNFMIKL
jgi:microcystin-dependent protein